MTTALKRVSGRQHKIFAYIDVVLANLATTVALPLINVPAGAVITAGGLVVSAAFNSTSTDVIDIGDSGSANRYLNDGNIHTTGLVALVPTHYQYTAPTDVTGTWVSGGGTPTTGAFRFWIEYYQAGRAQFAQGSDSA